jgi:hypothetical protein
MAGKAQLKRKGAASEPASRDGPEMKCAFAGEVPPVCLVAVWAPPRAAPTEPQAAQERSTEADITTSRKGPNELSVPPPRMHLWTVRRAIGRLAVCFDSEEAHRRRSV